MAWQLEVLDCSCQQIDSRGHCSTEELQVLVGWLLQKLMVPHEAFVILVLDGTQGITVVCFVPLERVEEVLHQGLDLHFSHQLICLRRQGSECRAHYLFTRGPAAPPPDHV